MTVNEDDIVLVDTDVFSYLLNGHELFDAYRGHLEGKRLALSFVTVGELLFGALRRGWGDHRLQQLQGAIRAAAVVPHDYEICLRYAEIKSSLETAGTPVADNDLWIAACAVRHSIPLVSHNRKHFIRVPDLRLISAS